MTTTSDDGGRRRVRRAPHVLCVWGPDRRLVQSARRTAGVPASPIVLELLDRAGAWIAVADLAVALDLPPFAIDALLGGLEAHDLVEYEASCDAATAGTHRPTGSPSSEDAGPWGQWSPAAFLFHLATRDVEFGRRSAPAVAIAGERPPPVLPPQGEHEVALPMPRLEGTLRRALQQRRTHRRFSAAPLSSQDVGTLLGVTFGVQAWAQAPEGPLALKTSPSGGARHSLEAYVWLRKVEGLPPGVYHYRADAHRLSRLDDRAGPDHVTRWLPAQDGYEGAAVVVVLASVLARVAWRYRSARAYRVVLIEAGHLAQTFCLVASGLGLAPFCTAALADGVIEADLGLAAATSPVMYVIGAGRPAPGDWRPHADTRAPRLDVTHLGKALADEP